MKFSEQHTPPPFSAKLLVKILGPPRRTRAPVISVATCSKRYLWLKGLQTWCTRPSSWRCLASCGIKTRLNPKKSEESEEGLPPLTLREQINEMKNDIENLRQATQGISAAEAQSPQAIGKLIYYSKFWPINVLGEENVNENHYLASIVAAGRVYCLEKKEVKKKGERMKRNKQIKRKKGDEKKE